MTEEASESEKSWESDSGEGGGGRAFFFLGSVFVRGFKRDGGLGFGRDSTCFGGSALPIFWGGSFPSSLFSRLSLLQLRRTRWRRRPLFWDSSTSRFTNTSLVCVSIKRSSGGRRSAAGALFGFRRALCRFLRLIVSIVSHGTISLL